MSAEKVDIENYKNLIKSFVVDYPDPMYDYTGVNVDIVCSEISARVKDKAEIEEIINYCNFLLEHVSQAEDVCQTNLALKSCMGVVKSQRINLESILKTLQEIK